MFLAGSFPSVDENLYLYPEFDIVNLLPFSLDTTVNNYAWMDFWKSMCGYNPTFVSSDGFGHEGEIAAMPVYPANGSIAIIDDAVVIKLSDN